MGQSRRPHRRRSNPKCDGEWTDPIYAQWGGGHRADPTELRVTLRRLFDRIETADQPAELWRVFKLTAADVVQLVRGLASKVFRIPPTTAGWDWTASPAEAAAIAGSIGKGWKVAVQVTGSTKAIDIQALRPGKPGFVIVGGTEFKVSGFAQDVSTRTLAITLTEK